jgi:16S rRNA G527 N7-methylase RsmG
VSQDTVVGMQEGLEALGLALDARQQEQLAAYLALLAKWNKTYNLTAIREPSRMVTHHVLAFPAFRSRSRVPAGGWSWWIPITRRPRS